MQPDIEVTDDDDIAGKFVSTPPISKKRHRADVSGQSGLLHGTVNMNFDYSNNEELDGADVCENGGLLQGGVHETFDYTYEKLENEPSPHSFIDKTLNTDCQSPEMMPRADTLVDTTKIDKKLRAGSRHTEKMLRAGIQCVPNFIDENPLASSRRAPMDEDPLASSRWDPQSIDKNPLVTCPTEPIDKNPLASSRSSEKMLQADIQLGPLPIDTKLRAEIIRKGFSIHRGIDTNASETSVLLHKDMTSQHGESNQCGLLNEFDSGNQLLDGRLLHSPSTTEEESRHEAWPNNLLSVVAMVLEHNCECPSPPLFQFDISSEAAEQNFCVLVWHRMSLEKALNSQ